MKWFSILVLLAMSSTLFAINLDPYLLQHSIYAEKQLSINNESTLPKAGIVGTYRAFGYTGGYSSKAGEQLPIYTEVIADTLIGTKNIVLDDGSNIPGVFDPGTQYGMWENLRVKSGGSLTYVTNRKNTSPANGGGVINVVSSVYNPKKPIMPDLSGITFNGGTNIVGGTHFAGHYGSLNGSATLVAGTYYFDEINLPANDTIFIQANNGDYYTEIYVKNHVEVGVGAVITPKDSDKGKGKLLMVLRADEPEKKITELSVDGTFYVHDNAHVAATILAPTSRIMFRNNATISGQAFGEKIHFIGFDGGSDLDFVPLNQVEIFPKDLKFNEDDGDTVISVQLAGKCSDSTGKVHYQFQSGTATLDVDVTFDKGWSGVLQYPVGDSLSIEDIGITIIDDSEYEGDETFTMRLFDPTDNIDLGSDTLITFTIVDNDSQNANPPIVHSDTITCAENGNVSWSPLVTDADN